MKWALLLALLVSGAGALTAEQSRIKHLVYAEAKKYTRYPTLMVNICETESSFGRNILGDDRKSLGVMQVQVATARDLVRMYPKRLGWLKKISDKRLAILLLINVAFNVKLAALRFEYYRKLYGWREALSRHNGGRNNRAYIKKVLAKRGTKSC